MPAPPPRQEYRGTIVDQLCRDSLGKRGLSCSPDLRLTHFLTTEHCIGRWLLEGLPRDELSIQNAVIVSQSARCGPADGPVLWCWCSPRCVAQDVKLGEAVHSAAVPTSPPSAFFCSFFCATFHAPRPRPHVLSLRAPPQVPTAGGPPGPGKALDRAEGEPLVCHDAAEEVFPQRPGGSPAARYVCHVQRVRKAVPRELSVPEQPKFIVTWQS